MLYFIGNTVLLMFFVLSLVAASSAFARNDNKGPFELSDIQDNLEQLLSEELKRDDLQIKNVSIKREDSNKTFSLKDIRNIKLPSKFTISGLNIDKKSANFSADVTPEVGTYTIKASGEFTALTKIPVLSKNIDKGQVITQDDIEFKFVDSDKLKATNLTDITEILGKSADKNLAAGSVVQFNSLSNPVLVKKNQAVNAIYKVKNLEVKTVAIAVEDGREGEIIKLRNHESGKIFQALVDKDGNVNTNLEILNENIALNGNNQNRKIN